MPCLYVVACCAGALGKNARKVGRHTCTNNARLWVVRLALVCVQDLKMRARRDIWAVKWPCAVRAAATVARCSATVARGTHVDVHFSVRLRRVPKRLCSIAGAIAMGKCTAIGNDQPKFLPEDTHVMFSACSKARIKNVAVCSQKVHCTRTAVTTEAMIQNLAQIQRTRCRVRCSPRLQQDAAQTTRLPLYQFNILATHTQREREREGVKRDRR